MKNTNKSIVPESLLPKADKRVMLGTDSPTRVLTIRSTERGNLKFQKLCDLIIKKLSEDKGENNIRYFKPNKITKGDVLEEAVDLLTEKYNKE